MKKFFLISMLFLRVLFSSAAQTGPVDLVLLLDVSASMSSSYGEVRDYLSGPFLREFLRFGDTFHIISFSETPGIEIVRRVEGRGDLETVIGRLFLMYPVEPYSDIAGALNYAERYISFLPENRPKKIVIITDGDESMRPGAASGGAGISPDTVDAHVAETAVRLRKAGADLYLVRVPLAGRSGPSPGREPLPSQRTETATAAPARPSPAPATVPAPAPATPRATAPEPATPQAAPPARSATPAPAPATP
ncbi:MAG: VWA domain-containing protein, partial [Spirochaetaceae bacterium]|nr:VWA domain-containing protein [Spirochaetaceae bacterium]